MQLGEALEIVYGLAGIPAKQLMEESEPHDPDILMMKKAMDIVHDFIVNQFGEEEEESQKEKPVGCMCCSAEHTCDTDPETDICCHKKGR